MRPYDLSWDDLEDSVEKDLRAGRLGEYGPFEGWPEEECGPEYQMLRELYERGLWDR